MTLLDILVLLCQGKKKHRKPVLWTPRHSDQLPLVLCRPWRDISPASLPSASPFWWSRRVWGSSSSCARLGWRRAQEHPGITFPFELSHSWQHLQCSSGTSSQTQHMGCGVIRALLEEAVSQQAGSTWMGSFTTTLISGFAFLCKSKTSFLADLTWIISKLLFLWVIWVWNQSEKINCAPALRVFLYQLASELP